MENQTGNELLCSLVADECEDKYYDMGTNDFLISIMQKHEKMAWMLRAHLDNSFYNICYL
ncbi:MAG TPA: hypothetical protein VE595_02225 [Nitrososphaeraceae archaeon]|nr:hypothetical protein [Nitrososphaeraceae archaeon]